MKKFLILTLIAFVILSLFACDDTGTNQSTLLSTTDTLPSILVPPSEPPKDGENPNKAPEKQLQSLLSHFTTEEISTYSEIECGDYKGNDFNEMLLGGSLYRIIDNYDDLCSLTSMGMSFPRSLFDKSIVLVLCRKEPYRDYGYGHIGYSNFTLVANYASIEELCWSTDSKLVDNMEWTEIVYLQIPRELYDQGSKVIGGQITVKEKEKKVFDLARIEVESTINDGYSAYLMETSELSSFLKEHNLSDKPLNWSSGENYNGEGYKILALCYETDRPEPIGYTGLALEEGGITIDRCHLNTSINSKKTIFEFVAIPTEILNKPVNDYKYITINCTEYTKQYLVSDGKITDTEIVEMPTYEYYDFLNLGIYYYESDLPIGDAYHIIENKGELEAYVENPYLTSSFFDDNYVVVLRLENRNPKNSFGIRDLKLYESDLRVTMEYGDDSKCYSGFQSDICYLAVPKNKLNYNKYNSNQRPMGTVTLKSNNYKSRREYYVTSYSAPKGYNVKENTSWIITNYNEAREFSRQTGIDLPSMSENHFLFIYYGGTGASSMQMSGFLSNDSNVYVNLSYVTKPEATARFFVTEISSDFLKCTSESITAHMFMYKQNRGVWQDSPDKLEPPLNHFYAADYSDTPILKEPEFKYKIITNQVDYESVILEYTSIESPHEISFNDNYVIAYYVTEGCTGCPGATSFGNVRVAGGRMYIDTYVENHSGGDAETSTLYFIIISKEYFAQNIENIYLIEKTNDAGVIVNLGDWSPKMDSEYFTHIIASMSVTHSSTLKEKPNFNDKIITDFTELEELYAKYTRLEEIPSNFRNLDFNSMCVLAVYYDEGSSMYVDGGFRDMRVSKNAIYIEKYYSWQDEEYDIIGDCAMYMTLHLIAVEKSFIPEEINEIFVISYLHGDIHPDIRQ